MRLAENVGPIPVIFRGGLSANTQGTQIGVELDRAEVSRLIGLSEDDLDLEADAAGCFHRGGVAVRIARRRGTVASQREYQDEAVKWLRERGARWFYVLGPTGGQKPAWRARMQFNGGEDPATGSAAGCAISYLVARAAVAPDERIALRQGVEMGRPSDLYLTASMRNGSTEVQSARVVEVRVGGSTVLVAKGKILVP